MPEPTDDTGLILEDRYRTVSRDAALDRLFRSAEPTVTEGGPPIPISGDTVAEKPVGQPLRIGPARYVGEAWRRAKSVAGDVLLGAVETPRQVAGGALDAAEAVVGLGSILDDLAPIGALQLFDKETGAFDPRLFSAEEFAAQQEAGEAGERMLPELDEAATTTGGMVRGVSQFLTGFALAGGAGRAAKLTPAASGGGRLAGAAAKGSAADFAAFDAHEGRLSDLLEEVPALQNPVTGFLASDPTDSEAEGRFKNAVEGLGLGAATEGFVKALRTVRAVRGVRSVSARGSNRAVDVAAEDMSLPARDMLLLGSPDAPLTARSAEASLPPSARLAEAFDETEPGVPTDVAAKALTDRGLTPLGKSEVYVNFARIAAPEDIQQVIKDTADAMKPSIDAARRGVRSHAATKLAAADVDAWNLLLSRRSGEALNAEESLAARELWVASADKLKAVAEEAVRAPSPENLFQFRRMLATYHAVQKEVIAARTETARALNAWKIPAGGSKERMNGIRAAVSRGGGLEVNWELAKKVLAADAIGGRAELSRWADSSVYVRTRDGLQEAWINGLLSGPKTHMVNMLSNSSVIALTMSEHAVAARLGRLLGSVNGVEVGEALAQAHGVKTGMREAFVNAAKTFRSGETGFGLRQIEGPTERAISSTAWNLRSGSPQARAVDALGAIATTPGRALLAEDEFFKTIGYRMSLHATAFRQAQREIRSGRLKPAAARGFMADVIANPPEELRLEAAAIAAYQTFTNKPGPIVRGLNRIRHEVPMLRFIIPFLNTPANIFKYTLERTPLAPWTARYQAAVAEGGAAADLARTKMAIGTFTSLLAMDLALDGTITGSGPAKKEERQLLLRSGWKPYSVRIGEKYVAFNRLDPVGNLLQFGGDLGEFLVNADDMDADNQVLFERALAATAFAGAEALNSKAALTGLSDFLEAVSEPDRFGSAYLKRFAGSFVPVGVREAATAMDPVARETASMIDEMKARLPGYSDDLPARRDYWGREIRYESGLGRSYDVMSPLYGSRFDVQPVDKAMADDGWFPGTLPKAFNLDKVRVNFSDQPKIYSRFLELRGSTKAGDLSDGLAERFGDVTLLEALNGIVQGEGERGAAYRDLDDPDKREKALRKVIEAYQDAAKGKLVEEFPELMARRDVNAARQRRLSVPVPGLTGE